MRTHCPDIIDKNIITCAVHRGYNGNPVVLFTREWILLNYNNVIRNKDLGHCSPEIGSPRCLWNRAVRHSAGLSALFTRWNVAGQPARLLRPSHVYAAVHIALLFVSRNGQRFRPFRSRNGTEVFPLREIVTDVLRNGYTSLGYTKRVYKRLVG